jgi:general secretion pathway protein L
VAEYLLVQLAEEAQEASWAAFDAAGHLLTPVAHGPLAAARAAAEGRRVMVMVPAPDVITTQAAVPPGSLARSRQLVPYSLEESLADDVEALAFAVGPRLGSGAVAVSVTAKQRLDGWLAALRAAGLTGHAMFAESDGVPDMPSTLTLMLRGTRIYGRRAGHPPFALDGVTIAQVLDLLRGTAEQTADLNHLLVYTDEAGRLARQSELVDLHERASSTDIKLLPDGVFPHLAATLIARPGTNLLQGPYATKSNWVALARPWRAAATLFVALGALALAGQVVEYLSLRREDTVLTDLLATDCERVAASARLATCEAEVRRRLGGAAGAGRGGESFLSTLAAVAEAGGGASRIEALSYRNQIMDLQLMASSVAALDEFERALDTTQRFEARIESSNTEVDGVQGRIQVVGASQ